MWPTTPIIEAEFNDKDDKNAISTKFKENDENWHNGKTFLFESEENEDENIKHCQFKTIIEENNRNYFIYDEIIEINNKPVLLLELHDDEKEEVWQQLIYLEKDEVVQQIRHLSSDQFFNEFNENEISNNKKFIKLTENDTTTIVRMPFLDFINSVNQGQTEEWDTSIKDSKFRKILWKISKVTMFLVAWAGIGLLSGLVVGPLITPLVPPLVAGALIALTCGAIVGGTVIAWETYKDKIKAWLLPNWKRKKDLQLQKELRKGKTKSKQWFLSLTREAKVQAFAKSFGKIWDSNKSKTFENIQKELSKKFEKNKQDVKTQEFSKIYAQKVQQWNENWNETVKFSENLKPRDISKIKEVFNESDATKKHMCDGFFYKPKQVWEEFQEEKIMENVRNLFENPEKNDNLEKEDIRKKSPVKNMRRASL
ncbi:hypothetical protein [Spiroplasma endosymbiont of Melieria omissa]|uniref:hypothetical protein n=1 Tax=Spiroplasma endosymbiont of Melieria omissa TaxID=3139324 RepID=UPI003CCAE2C1